MKILITGTHFTPAVATIEELRKYKDVNVVYVGRATTMEGDNVPSVESEVFPGLGIKFIPIFTGRLQMVFTVYTIFSLLKVPVGFLQALYIIFKEKPDIILSFGGYVSVPVCLAGWLLSVPIFIHEQTLISGLSLSFTSIFADKIAVSFKERVKGEKYILTGNPIRQEIISKKRNASQNRRQILITGGNQGSHVINLAVLGSLEKLTKMAKIIHVTGDNKYRDFDKLDKLQNDNYKVVKWVGKGWVETVSSSDLVVCRAGINTLGELAILGIPALTIPIPYLSGDEQNKNARYFERLGLVKILPQSKLSHESLVKNIKDMLVSIDKLKQNAKVAKETIIRDGAKRLAFETVLLGSGAEQV